MTMNRTISAESYAQLEESIDEIREASALLGIMQNAFAGPDGTADPEECSTALAGIVRKLDNVTGQLDQVADAIMKGKLEAKE